jgi:hypothetical protein
MGSSAGGDGRRALGSGPAELSKGVGLTLG